MRGVWEKKGMWKGEREGVMGTGRGGEGEGVGGGRVGMGDLRVRGREERKGEDER